MRWPIFLLGGIKIKYVGTVIPLNPKMYWGPTTINECYLCPKVLLKCPQMFFIENFKIFKTSKFTAPTLIKSTKST